MSFASPTVKGAPAAAGLAFLTAAFWVLRGYVWPTLSNVEVGPLQALLDPTLFREDFVVREALRFSPRFSITNSSPCPAGSACRSLGASRSGTSPRSSPPCVPPRPLFA